MNFLITWISIICCLTIYWIIRRTFKIHFRFNITFFKVIFYICNCKISLGILYFRIYILSNKHFTCIIKISYFIITNIICIFRWPVSWFHCCDLLIWCWSVTIRCICFSNISVAIFKWYYYFAPCWTIFLKFFIWTFIICKS